MKKIIMVMITLAVLLSACSKPASLDGTKWTLSNLDGKTALADVTVTLNFSKDAIGGSDGCNSYGGSYTVNKGAIQFKDTFSTEMYCTDEINTQSTTYYDVLNKVSDYMVDSQLLTLFNADGKKLAEFVPSQK